MEKYDIFVSYSHHDNLNEGNWVTVFVDRLENDYFSRVGKKLKIFLDREGLCVGDVLGNKIKEALDQSLLFVPVLSPAYMASEWCRKEFLYFKDKHKDWLYFNNSSRIVPLKFMPYETYVPDPSWAADVKNMLDFLVGKEAGKEILYKDFYRERLPLSPNDAKFRDEVARFSEDVHRLVEAVKFDQFIFLGYTFGPEVGYARVLREVLQREWSNRRKYRGFKHQILPDEGHSAAEYLKGKEEEQIKLFIKKQLEQSNLAVLLFDDIEGAKTIDTGVPIIHLQYRLALEEIERRENFEVIVSIKTTDDCATSQLKFILSILDDVKLNKKIKLVHEFSKNSLLDIVDELINKFDKKVPADTDGHSLNLAFYIYDSRDRSDDLRNEIVNIIQSEGYEIATHVFNEDSPIVKQDVFFENNWMNSNRAIVLLLNANTAWCNATKIELLKIATNKKPPYGMAICVSNPDAEQRVQDVVSKKLEVIDCTKPEYRTKLKDFLNANNHV